MISIINDNELPSNTTVDLGNENDDATIFLINIDEDLVPEEEDGNVDSSLDSTLSTQLVESEYSETDSCSLSESLASPGPLSVISTNISQNSSKNQKKTLSISNSKSSVNTTPSSSRTGQIEQPVKQTRTEKVINDSLPVSSPLVLSVISPNLAKNVPKRANKTLASLNNTPRAKTLQSSSPIARRAVQIEQLDLQTTNDPELSGNERESQIKSKTTKSTKSQKCLPQNCIAKNGKFCGYKYMHKKKLISFPVTICRLCLNMHALQSEQLRYEY